MEPAKFFGNAVNSTVPKIGNEIHSVISSPSRRLRAFGLTDCRLLTIWTD